MVFSKEQSAALYETLINQLAVIEKFTRVSRHAGLRTVAFLTCDEKTELPLTLIKRMAFSITERELRWYDYQNHGLQPLTQEQIKLLLDRSEYLHRQCMSFTKERAFGTECQYMHDVISQGC